MLTILKTVILAFTWLVLPILTGCLFGLLLGAVLRTGADRTRRKMVTDEAYAGLLRPARCFDNPVGRRYNLQMASAGSDPEDKQNESGYYSACSSAYPCGRGRICSEPDGGAYGGAGHDHVHDGFVV